MCPCAKVDLSTSFFFFFAATLLVWILCLLSSKTKSPGDSSSIKENPSKGHPSSEKRDKCAWDVFQRMRLVSPAPPFAPVAMAAATSQTLQKCTPSPSSFSFHGFMQIVFNKSMLIQGPQVQAGSRKVTLRGEIFSSRHRNGKTALFFSPPSGASQALVLGSLLHCCFAHCLLRFIYFLIYLTAAAWLWE